MATRLLLLFSLSLVLALITPAGTPAAAPAAPEVNGALYPVTVVGSDTAAAGTFGVERVLCPEGTVAVGGGVDVDNVITMKVTSSAPTFLGDDSRLLSRPDGINAAPIGWQVSVLNTAGATQGFKLAVICAPPAGVSTMVGSDSAEAGGWESERVLCPAGSVALGGGIDMENVLTMQASASAPTFAANSQRLIFQPDGVNPAPVGWQATAINNGVPDRLFKVGVICAPLTGVSAMVGSDTAAPGTFGVERVYCPAGQVALGGGLDPQNVLTTELTASAPVFDADQARLIFQSEGVHPPVVGWQASSYNDDSEEKDLKVGVICIQKASRSLLPLLLND